MEDGKTLINVCRQISRIAEMIPEDGRCRNALKNSDEQGARIEIEEALRRAVNAVAGECSGDGQHKIVRQVSEQR